MTVALETKTTPVTSLAQTQELIMTIFSCVGYLRDLFPDSSFQDHKMEGMSLKRFKRGGDASCDELLNWIETGCFDALQKKYLKSAVLTVLADTSSPNNVLETYTLKVSYPDSVIHQRIDAATDGIAKLSLSRNDQAVLAVEAKPGSFKESVSKILRGLCVMTQTLKLLPVTKYLSMKLAYYDEVTPPEYEPPGFVAAEFDIDHLFQGPTTKYSFGRAVTPYHGIGLSMETMCDDKGSTLVRSKAIKSTEGHQNVQNVQNVENIRNFDSQVVANNTINVQDGLGFDESILIASQIAHPSNSPPQFPSSQQPQPQPQSQSQAFDEPVIPDKPERIIRDIVDLPASQQVFQQVLCTCGVNEKDVEMLRCDSCHKWQHSVCAGYISNRDRRLEIDSSYVCYYCRFYEQRKTLEFLRKLSLFRKGLAMISAHGFSHVTNFSERMGIGFKTARRICSMMEKEKFLVPQGRFYRVAKKDDGIKERIKFYFNLNLEIHEEFVEAQRQDKHKRPAPVKDDSLLQGPKKQDSINNKIISDDDTFEPQKSTVKEESPKTPTTIPSKSNSSLRTPPTSTAIVIKKRKISIPSVKISCYSNKN